MIAFGAGGRFNYLETSTATTCNDTVFDDPAPNVAKWCYVQTTQPASPGWQQCATENQNCAYSDLMTVAYGANGAYKFATLGSGGTACDNAVFGDPAPNAAKACFLLGPPPDVHDVDLLRRRERDLHVLRYPRGGLRRERPVLLRQLQRRDAVHRRSVRRPGVRHGEGVLRGVGRMNRFIVDPRAALQDLCDVP